MRALLALLFLAWTLPALAQGIPIGALPNAATPLTGSEYAVLSQNGNSVKATVSQLGAPSITCATARILGNVSGSTGAASCLTATQVDTLLGLGTAAFVNTGTSGATIPLLNGANTWSALQTLTAGLTVSAGATNLAGLIDNGTLNVSNISSLGTGSARYVTITGGASTPVIATNAGDLTLAPASAITDITGALVVSTNATISGTLGVTGAATLSSTLNVTGTSTLGVVSAGATTTTALTATGAVSLSPANANVVISPTGSGLVTISPATLGSLDRMTIGGTTPAAATVTALTATGAVALSPASANVVLSPTGTGVVTINPATAGTLNNMAIGGSTPLAGAFTTVSATGQITSTIATGTAPLVVASTTVVANLNASSLSGATFAAPGPIGSGTPSTGAFTTLSNTGGLTFSGAAAPISCNGAAGTSGQFLTSAGAGATCSWSTSSAFLTWQGLKTVDFTAVSNNIYCVDTLTTGAVTMTLPAAPADGDKVLFIDCKSNFATTNLTVARNAKNIMGLAANMTVNTNNAASTLVYVSANSDWRMY